MFKKTAFLTLLCASLPLLMAPNHRPHDHIGNFNFKVEIEGVTQGAFKNVEGLDTEVEIVAASWREQAPGQLLLDGEELAGEVPALDWTRWARATWVGGGDAERVRVCPFPKRDERYFPCLKRALLDPIATSIEASNDPELRARLGEAYNEVVQIAQLPDVFLLVRPSALEE